MNRSCAVLYCAWTLMAGCAAHAIRSQSPEETDSAASKVRFVGDITVPYGMHPIIVEAVGLVTGLPGTGSDPAPSPQRAALKAEMKTRGVSNPDEVLALPSTALVLVRGFIRPGIQKGDRFDVEVRIPSQSDTTSLRGGWLLETRLKELAVLNSHVHEGSLWGLVEGPILVEPGIDQEENSVLLGRGRVLGGGVFVKSRPLGLVLKPKHQSVHYSARIGNVVNRRFHTFSRGVKRNVAHPHTDEYIELAVHPKYKDNVARYVQVVRSVPLNESDAMRLARLELLERQLADPITSSTAVVRLEAIGRQAVEALIEGTGSDDREVRFYAAEALAYLDHVQAVETLAEAARQEPAFRVFALTALSAMDEAESREALRSLLSSPSAETRYGAFRALRAMNSNGRLVRGEKLGEGFGYHVLNVEGPPMIHLTRSYRPEIVLFGADHRLKTPLTLEAGEQIVIRSSGEEEVIVSRFEVGEPSHRRVVSNGLDDVIRAVVELGGTYPDVVGALQQAKETGALKGRLAVDAVPQAGRTYVRGQRDASDADDPKVAPVVTNPLPNLFPRWQLTPSTADRKTLAANDLHSRPEKNDQPPKRFFGRMLNLDAR